MASRALSAPGASVTRASNAVRAAEKLADGDRRAASSSAILRAVLEYGPVPRSTVARLTGLSPAAVTGHCAGLLDLGLIRELPGQIRSNGAGRPHIPVELDTSRYLAGAVHIAVPATTVALVDLHGQVVAQRREPHPDTDPERVARRAADSVSALFH